MKSKTAILISIFMFFTVSAVAQNQLKGEWQLISMIDEDGGDVSLPKEFGIRLYFVNPVLRIWSCNNVLGKYSAGKKNIKFTLIRTTVKHCPGIEKEQTFNKLLKMADTYSGKNNELILSGKKSKLALTFKKKVDEKAVNINGKWELVSMTRDGKSIPLIGKAITLNIDKNKIGGNGGCNSYGGSFSQKGKEVTFSEIFSTKMWCDNAPTESQYFQTLTESVHYEMKNGQLVLTDEKKENILIFKVN